MANITREYFLRLISFNLLLYLYCYKESFLYNFFPTYYCKKSLQLKFTLKDLKTQE